MAATLGATKIRVNRARLVEALEARQLDDTREYQAALKRWEALVEKARGEVRQKAAKVGASVDRLEPSNHRYAERLSLTLSSVTEVPPKPRDLNCEVRSLIETLRLSDDETITLSAEQYQHYFPCEVPK